MLLRIEVDHDTWVTPGFINNAPNLLIRHGRNTAGPLLCIVNPFLPVIRMGQPTARYLRQLPLSPRSRITANSQLSISSGILRKKGYRSAIHGGSLVH